MGEWMLDCVTEAEDGPLHKGHFSVRRGEPNRLAAAVACELLSRLSRQADRRGPKQRKNCLPLLLNLLLPCIVNSIYHDQQDEAAEGGGAHTQRNEEHSQQGGQLIGAVPYFEENKRLKRAVQHLRETLGRAQQGGES